jgi:hypothetical protein
LAGPPIRPSQETPTKGLRGARQVDVKHKRCVHDTCQKRPSFNFSGETRALYCGPHRLPGMVNVDQERRRVNRGAPRAPADVAQGTSPYTHV